MDRQSRGVAMVSETWVERTHAESKTASSTYLTDRRMLARFFPLVNYLTLARPRAANAVKIGSDVRNPPVGEQSSAFVIATGAAKAAAAILVQIGEEEETRKHQRNGDERKKGERAEATVSAETGESCSRREKFSIVCV
jgi:hypothetical protein